ncbi:MAG: glycosyltransferase family 2 protein [Candidatus Saccharimonadales bacterium]|nr:glycosyltransferase family 2 protein [Candidatus Saccharimonadales bacterium]
MRRRRNTRFGITIKPARRGLAGLFRKPKMDVGPWVADPSPLGRIALVIAAHNEELFLRETIRSAIAAGQPKRDIYVVDDGSWDRTREIAKEELGFLNVTTIPNSGKSNAINYIVNSKQLPQRYDWIHLTDADGMFGKDYFRILRRSLRPESAVASAYMRSLPGTRTAKYRIYEYAWAMELVRPFQTLLNLITIVPGPTACFRADVFEKLSWGGGTMTEDFDVTMQVRRRKLGKVQFIREAYVLTQDPENLRDFANQILRWYRGLFQVVKLHGLGLKMKREDFYFIYQFIEVIFVFALFFIIGPLSAFLTGNWTFLSLLFLYHVVTMMLGILAMSVVAREFSMLLFFPRYYVMRWLNLLVFLFAFVEVELLGKHKPGDNRWSTVGRRYAIETN